MTARAFVTAWESGDRRAMYRLVAPRSRPAHGYPAFAAAYTSAQTTAGLRSVHRAAPVRLSGGVAQVPMEARTQLFGALTGTLRIPLVDVDGDYRVLWSPAMVFPGLAGGEHLVRAFHTPRRRGAILSRSYEALASGPPDERTYPQGTPFALITGYVQRPETAAAVQRRSAAGWPATAAYGQGGLEGSLDRILAGSPGVRLSARSAHGDRLLGVHPGAKPHNVVTTLSVPIQQAATDALGDKLGGVVVLDARTGALRAAAGDALTTLQPPGSTFKTITASAAFLSGKAHLTDTFPYERFALIGSTKLRNFHRELCGGTLVNAFAQSCNSVFAPLAIKVGADKLFSTATRFGFNQTPSIRYPVPASVIPRPVRLNSDWEVGVAGIGQGGVTATPLQMATVAETIAHGGAVHAPWLVRLPAASSDARPARSVIPASVAGDVAEMMKACVSYGTCQPAQSSLATVAGKTGTAELGKNIKSDAWFIGYAPAQAPRVVVAVLVVHGGVGGQTAAPIARAVIDAALENP